MLRYDNFVSLLAQYQHEEITQGAQMWSKSWKLSSQQ
jgi:hypothetical protein